MSVGLPTHYQLRLDHISHEVSRLPREAISNVVLLGDAHVEGNTIKELNGAHVINMGIQEDQLGADCHGLRDRLWHLPMARPGHVVIMTGLNDLRDGRAPDAIERCYADLVERVQKQSPEATVHIALIPPTRDKYAKLMHHIALLNAMLEELAEKKELPFVDFFSGLEDDDGVLASTYTEDGYYLNDTGFDKLNEILERHLTKGDSY